MGLISPVQTQTAEEEGCSKKRKEDELIHILRVDIPDSDFDEEEEKLKCAKLIAELKKERKKRMDVMAYWNKPNCETNICKPVATDMGPGDKPKKTRGKNKKKKKKKRRSCY